MRRLGSLLAAVALVLAAAPAFAGEILFVSDTTTDATNLPAVLSGGSAEVAHATIAGARFRPAASAAFHDVTIVRNDFVITGGVVGLAEGTNPALAGGMPGVTLADYCAIYWSASGPHEPDTLVGAGLGADGGLHTDAAVFSSLSAFVAAGGWVFVTGHDACADPTDPLLLAFLGGAGATGTQVLRPTPNAPPLGTLSATATFLTTALTDIRGATPGVVSAGGVNPVDGVQDLDCLTGIDVSQVLGVLAEPLVPGGFQWTVRVPSGIADLSDPAAGRIAYVAAGEFLYEDLPSHPGTFLADGEDPAWSGDPVYGAALLNFAAGSCPVPLDAICPASPQTLECNAPGGRDEAFVFTFRSAVATSATLAWTVDGAPGPGSPMMVGLLAGQPLDLVIDPGPALVWAPGAHTISVTATAGTGSTAACVLDFTIADTMPPTVTLVGPAAPTLDCGAAYAERGASAADVCDGALAVVIGGDAVDTSMSGVYVVTYTAMDAAGNVGMATRTVTVQGATPPVITSSLARTLLWPASNGLLPVGLAASAADSCGTVGLSISVFSDEAAGAPPLAPDAIAMGTAASLRLRAERLAAGNGRVYVVVITATNGAGVPVRSVLTSIVPLLPTAAHIMNAQAQAAAAAASVDPVTGTPAAPYDLPMLSFPVP